MVGSENHTSWSPSFAICLIIRANMETRRNCKVSIWKAFEKGLGVLRKGVSFQKIWDRYVYDSLSYRGKEFPIGRQCCSCDVVLASFLFKKWLLWCFSCRKIKNFKLKYLGKRYFQTVNGVRLLFVGSFMSDQLAFWVDVSFKKWPNASDF